MVLESTPPFADCSDGRAAGAELAPGEVHFWTLDLEVTPAVLAVFGESLSVDEWERARRFHFDIHRNRFIAGRGILRRILGQYLGVRPNQIQFAIGATGKPSLINEPDLHFNLGHCEGFAVLGLTRRMRIGVDVERVRVLEDATELVERFFSRREAELFARLARSDKPIAFFNLWTRKEAFLKATGEGISRYLNQVEVSFLPSEEPQLLGLPQEIGHDPRNKWCLRSLEPAKQFVAAIACEGPIQELKCRCWTPEPTSTVCPDFEA